jgi:hypothetical protein
MRTRLLLLFLAGAAARAWAVGDDWRHSKPLPTSQAIHALAHDGSTFVAAGEHGTLLTSTDALTWEVANASVSGRLAAVVWTGTQFVAAGAGGALVTSPDGESWTSQVSPTRLAWRAVAWDGARLIAVGEAGAMATSTTGSAWSLVRPGVLRDLHGVAAGGGLIVAVGEQGTLLTSVNATTWTSIAPVTTQKLRAVAHNGARWVAVGDGGTLITSVNGSTWVSGSSGVGTGLRGLFWTGTVFVAVGDGGTIITSADGLSWTAQTSGLTGSLQTVAGGGGLLIAAGDSGAVATSTDAVAWTVRSSGAVAWLEDVIHEGSQFIAVGSQGSLSTSVDALTWTSRTSGTTATLHGVTSSGSRHVAVGDAGTIVSSSDGVSWTAQSSGVTTALHGVVHTSERFVAVGRSGRVVTSTDGLSWSAQNLGAAVHLRAVAWSGALLVAVGEGGIIRTSTNGTAWTARTSGVTKALEGVAWNGTLFVAAGADGTVLSSADGISWTAQSLSLDAEHDFAQVSKVRALGTSFVIVGSWGLGATPRAFMAESADGVVWAMRTVRGAPGLDGLASAAGSTVAVGEAGSVLLNAAANIPEVQVQALDSTVTEGVGSTQIAAVLSATAGGAVVVPFTLSGSVVVGVGGDVTLSVGQIVIPAGQLSASVTVTVVDDLFQESAEELILTLTTPLGATLGLDVTHTLTVEDNDDPPLITANPASEIVVVGTSVTLVAAATGDPPLAFQWKKGTAAIKGATAPSLTFPSATLAHAGAYFLTVTNPVSSATSMVAELAVVDNAAKGLSLVEGKTATFTVNAAGSHLSFQWFRGEEALANSIRVSGADSPTMVITGLTSADGGVYRCRVTSGGAHQFGGVTTLAVLVKPFVIAPVLGTLRVSQFFEAAVYAGHSPTSYTITGLPSGLAYNKTTGIISGRPLVPGGVQPFTVRFKATNAAGISPEVTALLTVLPLQDGTEGRYFGTVDREELLNPTSFLGGSMSLTVASNGKVTGSLRLGSSTHAFLPVLETSTVADPACSAVITRVGLPPLQVVFDLNPAGGLITGTVSDGAHTAPFRAWRAMAAPFTGFTGYHTCGLKLTTPGDIGDVAVPQGHGFATFTVSSTGTATGTLRLADGVNVPLSTPLRNTGALVIYAPLYTSTGSLLGTLDLAGGLVSTTGLDWFKSQQPATSTTRSYKDGFGPVTLLATGALYTIPTSPGLLMNLTATADDVPNARLTFAEGGAPDPANRLDVELRYSAPAVRDPQTPLSNPGLVTITAAASTGLFSGSFTLSDLDTTVTPNVLRKRVTAYDGVIARDVDAVLRGFGRFQLAKMPDNLVSPATTLNTSPKLSGRVLLAPLP